MKKAGKDPLVSLTEAIGCLEDIRPTALSHSDYEYWEEMLPVYTYTIEAYHQKRDSYRALEIAEKARSRRFLDSLGGKKVGAKGVAAYMLSQRADGIRLRQHRRLVLNSEQSTRKIQDILNS